MASISEQLRNTSESQKRASTVQARSGSLSKTDLRYWKDRIFTPTYTRRNRNGEIERHESPNWAVYVQHRGRRHKWSLETPNREAAAAKAKDIFLSLQAKGWEATIQKYRPKMAEKKRNVTVGEFIEAVKATTDLEPKSLEDYCRALRTIVAGAFGLEGGKEKFDYHKGGHKHWLAGINAVQLSALTPARIQEWKRAFLAKAGRSPVAQRRAKVSVNSFIRRARSLFSPDVLQHLRIELPDPLPFAGISFEPRQSLKYQSSFDIVDLIKKARTALAEPEPEQFKIFLLAVMVGLRRREIDLLEWASFRWDARIIRIEPTKWFHPKTEDSIGDIPIDPELIEIFRGYRARTKGEFVIESTREPNPEVTYNHYRCDDAFRALAKWLRGHGVKGNKPLHTLRKEYGSLVNAKYGIHAASRALRHAGIQITNEYYTDSRVRVTLGMGHLLKDQPDGDAEVEDKISDFSSGQPEGNDRQHRRTSERGTA